MSDLLQLIFSGLAQGAVYGLVAMGFVAVFAVREIVNLAQGEYSALAGLCAISAVVAGVPLPLAILLVVPLVVLVSVIIERVCIEPVRRMTPLVSIILTLGVSTALKAIMLLVWGPQARGLPKFPGNDIVLAGVSLRSQELWILGISVIVGAAVIWAYEHTLLGKSMRACAEQPIAARLVGISPRKATMLAFGAAGLVGAIAGIIGSPIYFSSWDYGLALGLKGFVAATLGGLVSLRVALVGGVVLGILENLVAGYIDSGYRDAVAFLVLLLVLLVRPQGLTFRAPAARV